MKLADKLAIEATIKGRLKEFLETWPEADYGPAHVVVSDQNLDDYFCNSALASIYKLLWQRATGTPTDRYNDHSDDELSATAQLLEWLMTQPRELRNAWHEWEYFDDEL